MRYLFVLCVLVLFLTSNAGEVKYELKDEYCSVVTKNSVVDFGTLPLWGEAGEPALPAEHLTLLLPAGADLATVTARLENCVYEVLPGCFEVTPVEVLQTTEDRHVADPVFTRSVVYTQNQLFPQRLIRSVQPGALRQYKLVDIVVQRYQFNPASGVLRAITAGELVVTFDEKEVRSTVPTPGSTREILQEVVDNAESMSRTYADVRAKSTYVIATTNSFQMQSLVLDSFIAIKENQGFEVELITEDSWGGGSGEAAMVKFRSWLKSNYESKNIEYLFIIGDPSLDSKIPMTHGPTNSETNPLVDYCYADLSSARWSSEYNEEKGRLLDFDKYAEIHVGRLPVYNSNVEQADKLLRKMIAYATEPTESAESWRFNALLPMANFSDAQNGVVFGEAIKKDILAPAGWGQFRIYKDHMGIPAEGYPLTYTNTRDYWNAGKFGIMIWQGHGLPTKTFSGPLEYVMDSPTAAGLTSDNPSHCFQVSCHNGCPFDPNNLAYALLKSGAISTIASAVQIWYSAMNTNYGTQGNGNDFGYIYAKHLVEDKLPAAAAFNKTRAYLPINGVQAWQNLTELNLYGCPATGVYTYGVSSSVGILSNQKISQNCPEVTVGSGLLHFSELHDVRELVVTDVQGRVVYRANLRKVSHIWDYRSCGVAPGVYLLSFRDTERSLYTLKTILQ